MSLNIKKALRLIPFLLELTQNACFGTSDDSLHETAITAPMPGMIVNICVQGNQEVEKGTVLCTVEAMKMQMDILAPHAGIVDQLRFNKDDVVADKELLFYLLPLISAQEEAHPTGVSELFPLQAEASGTPQQKDAEFSIRRIAVTSETDFAHPVVLDGLHNRVILRSRSQGTGFSSGSRHTAFCNQMIRHFIHETSEHLGKRRGRDDKDRLSKTQVKEIELASGPHAITKVTDVWQEVQKTNTSPMPDWLFAFALLGFLLKFRLGSVAHQSVRLTLIATGPANINTPKHLKKVA